MPFDPRLSTKDLFLSLGRAEAPLIVDVRIDDDFAADPRRLPGSVLCSHSSVKDFMARRSDRVVAVVCQRGLKLSEGAAAMLRLDGITARVLEGGFEAWKKAGLPLVPEGENPLAGGAARSLWVTRERPKIDRIACPWLIRRFIDRNAEFLFVRDTEVAAVAERFGAIPFDVEGVRWSHSGPECTFDTMIRAFDLMHEPMQRLAAIVRGADTARLDLAPQAAGLLAVSLGLSRLFSDDLAQLDAGMLIYDALYRWCVEASGETHNWPAGKTQ
ncbi:MAG TPA: sulfurtransferase/chromate resistance protein [Beijerinckiaceae bacterium]|nr:sulfurtransferase/chromate resistance protein [Beijerinckiaceae bacterium]